MNGFSLKPQVFDFLTVAMRSPWTTFICHSRTSPAESPRKTTIPSGTVALSDFDFGRAIEVFDFKLILKSLFQAYLFLPISWQMSLYMVSCF